MVPVKKRRLEKISDRYNGWDLWGADTSTGEADSGYEEEYRTDRGAEAGWDFSSYDGICKILYKWDHHTGSVRDSGTWRRGWRVKLSWPGINVIYQKKRKYWFEKQNCC